VSGKREWGVIGGGVLGMTLALRLAQQGYPVTLYEAASELGGLAAAWKIGDVVWDKHYHVILASDSRLRALLRELGLEQDLQWVETKTGFYTDGQFYSMSNSLEFLRFPPLNLIDKFRLALTILHASRIKNWHALENVLVADWLRKYSGENTTRKIWLPLLRAKLGTNYEKTSAAFIWATIARMYAARRSGLKKEMFGYLPGGYARILSALEKKARAAGVSIRTGCSLRELESLERVSLKFANGESATADDVVLTVPCHVAAKACSQLAADERQRLLGVEYQGILCASVLLKKTLGPYYVTNITEEWVPFTAVIEMTALVKPSDLGGNHLIYLPKYIPAEDPSFASSDTELRESFLGALQKMYPAFDGRNVLAFQVSRVRNVFAIPTLRYSAKLPPMATSVPGLYIVNSAHIVNGTLNVNETVALAERALPLILARTGTAARGAYARV
jgi:protoporphyrinogen oxidase